MPTKGERRTIRKQNREMRNILRKEKKAKYLVKITGSGPDKIINNIIEIGDWITEDQWI